MRSYTFFTIIFLILFLSACQPDTTTSSDTDSGQKSNLSSANSTDISFQKVDAGIDFKNLLKETNALHFYNFSYVYMGAGVATGDINNDGLIDIYFGANQEKNRLYLNKGNLKFEDITETAGVGDDTGWSTGVSMVDINNDGLLDIYVCRAGLSEDPAKRANLLYINQGDATFKEMGAQYKLHDPAYSTQAYFFDYDKDLDLDMYLVNHRIDFKNTDIISNAASIQVDPMTSDKMYRNDGGQFADVTMTAKIVNKTWGLSASVGDFNNDDWPDIYVANDFLEPDFLFINNQDGTFKEEIKSTFRHISYNSMGSDYADINNDGLQDLMVLDMAPESHLRSKTTMASMNPKQFDNMVRWGYHFQYMFNTLQLNNGNSTYSDIAQLVGVAKTDWSWAPLLADFNNDGLNDLFVTNGIKRDINDNDAKLKVAEIANKGEAVSLEKVLGLLPANKLPNYMYLNRGSLNFDDISNQAGINEAINSNGAAYADLDNDGDLDLVVNNLDDQASIFKNTNNPTHYLQVKLNGNNQNKFGIGTKVVVKSAGQTQTKFCYANRGYLSSVDQRLHFGLPNNKIDELTIHWPDGKVSKMNDVKTGQLLEVSQANAKPDTGGSTITTTAILQEISAEQIGIDFLHKENDYSDLDKETLLPHFYSRQGPFMSTGDVNGDGLDDFFVGGAKDQAGQIYLQAANMRFQPSPQNAFEKDKASEDMGSLFFDADKDGDLDLYVVSGGNEFKANSPLLQDRLYLNDGKGKFSRSKQALPKMLTSGSKVKASDFDQDGDMDLFVGGRIIPAQYPFPPASYLLQNEGGKFIDITKEKANELANIGMVSDAEFMDFDGDQDEDLIISGEWMPITFFENREGKWINVSDQKLGEPSKGWWYSIEQADIDQDGDMDLIAGNLGKNNKFGAKPSKPFHVYASDFDNNGSNDIVLSKKFQNKLVPVRGKECSSEQMPFIAEKFPTYKGFAEADLTSIYTNEKLNEALHYEAETFNSCLLINEGGQFKIQALPNEAQLGPITGLISDDINNDKKVDLIAVGNWYNAEVETIRYDAATGCILLNKNGQLKAIRGDKSGIMTKGNAKDICKIAIGKDKKNHLYLVSNNNTGLQAFYKK